MFFSFSDMANRVWKAVEPCLRSSIGHRISGLFSVWWLFAATKLYSGILKSDHMLSAVPLP